jgi:sterol desaturase/sphingolipid hydroxylase (fatty acid hydroxylase superfamily)
MLMINDILGLFDVRGLLLVSVVFVPLERLLALRKDQRVLRKWWWNDLIYVVVNGALVKAGLAGVIVGVMALSAWLVPAGFQAAVARQPYWLQTVEAIILADVGFYAAHRMFHGVPWLWRFHAIHHSIEQLDWLAAWRMHPLDQIVTKGLSLLPLYALGFGAVPIAIFAGIYTWHGILLHSNVRLNFGPLRWLIASPELHHWHHANQPEAYNKNYAGQLAFLDKLFGTMHMPAGRVPERYGVDDSVPHIYLSQLIYPLKKQNRADRAQEAAGPLEMAVGKGA